MYSSEKTVRVIRSPRDYRSANTAAQVRNQWLPPQPSVENEIRAAFQAGAYDDDRERLCNDLQRDPATLFQCLRTLPGFIPDSARVLDPLSALKDVPKSTLREFIDRALGNKSVHRVGRGSDRQRNEIARSIINSTAATSVTKTDEPTEINIGVVAHLRNLGRILVSWNYPRMFQRAQQIAEEDEIDLESAIEQVLGVAPQALGFAIAREWGLHPELLRCMVFDPDREPQNGEGYREAARVCSLIEEYVDTVVLVAPEKRDSEKVEGIESALTVEFGTESLKRLEVVIHSELESVRKRLAPKITPKEVVAERGPIIKLARASELSAAARETFESFIKRHAEHRSIRDGLDEVVRKTIPSLGFVSGVIYLLDKTQTFLVPVVQIGRRRPGGYSTVDVRKSGLISESLFAHHPIVQNSSLVDGELVSHVTGAASLLGQEVVISLHWSDRDALQGDPAALFSGLASCFSYLGDVKVLESMT